MVRKLRILLLLSLLLLSYSRTVVPSGSTITNEEQVAQALNFLEYKRYDRDLELFIKQLGHDESNNNWLAINSIGAFGEHQFMTNTLKGLGYTKITVDNFRKNPNIFPPEVQREALLALMNSNNTIMKVYIEKYQYKVYKGIRITKAGILAACHLAGPGGVQKFLKGLSNPTDMNGTTVAKYLRDYQYYNLNLKLI